MDQRRRQCLDCNFQSDVVAICGVPVGDAIAGTVSKSSKRDPIIPATVDSIRRFLSNGGSAVLLTQHRLQPFTQRD